MTKETNSIFIGTGQTAADITESMQAKAVRIYLENPRTDYHQMTADLCGIKRGPAKTINLGLAYGMGAVKLAMLDLANMANKPVKNHEL